MKLKGWNWEGFEGGVVLGAIGGGMAGMVLMGILLIIMTKPCESQSPVPVTRPVKVVDKSFVAFTAIDTLATGADLWTSVQAYGTHCHAQTCYSVVEANPFLGAHPSRGRLIGVDAGWLAEQIFAGYMLKKGHSRLWHLPFTIAVPGHAIAAWHNSRY